MTMIVREMILLDRQLFDSLPKPVDEFSDDSGWLGPPRTVPFAWEVAPGTPKRDLPVSSSPSAAVVEAAAAPPLEVSAQSTQKQVELAMVRVDSGRGQDMFQSGRHSIHILDNGPQAFLAFRHSEGSGDLWNQQSLMSFRKGCVPFQWEMEPGIPRDPDKCREFLNCPLTPPPVLHSRSMVVESSRKKHGGHISISEKMRSFFYHQDHLSKCRSPGAGRLFSRGAKKLLLKNEGAKSSPVSRSKKQSNSNSTEDTHSEEEDLSPVSVLDYSNSVRFHADSAPRLSSASSSVQSHYHTPKDSFSWDSNQDLASRSSSTRSSFRSRASKALSSKKGSFSSLLMQMHRRKKQSGHNGGNGCLMLLASSSSSRSGSFYDEEASECNGSEKSSSPPSYNSNDEQLHQQQHQQLKPTDGEVELKDDKVDGISVYGSPLAEEHASGSSSSGTTLDSDASRLQIVQRVDSLETIDPGFAPSEQGDERDDRILNRMVSLANWQRQPSRHRKGHLARNLVGVFICCYAPHHRREL